MNISRLVGLFVFCTGTAMLIAKAPDVNKAVVVKMGNKPALPAGGEPFSAPLALMNNGNNEVALYDDDDGAKPPMYFMPYYNPPKPKPVQHVQPTNLNQAKLADLKAQVSIAKMQADEAMWKDVLEEMKKKAADAKKAKEKPTFIGKFVKTAKDTAADAGSIFVIVVATSYGLKFFRYMNNGVGVGNYVGEFVAELGKLFGSAFWTAGKEIGSAGVSGVKNSIPELVNATMEAAGYVQDTAFPQAMGYLNETAYSGNGIKANTAWTAHYLFDTIREWL